MTDKFDAGNNVTPPTTTPGSNILPPSVAIKDSSGQLAKSVQLDSTGRGVYTKTLGANDQGVRTMNSSFLGKPGTTANFTQHVYDANGNLQGSLAGTVDQVVAGPGIYISSPNGQGVVTVSTQPLPTNKTSDTLFDVSWVYDTTDRGFGIVGEFVAVGVNGLNMRSRDGVNWVQMFPSGQTIIGISVEQASTLPDNHVEYNGVGLTGRSIYGRNGTNKDAMITVSQLNDQDGAITETFISTNIYEANAATGDGGSGGGGGGGGVPSTGTIELVFDWDTTILSDTNSVGYYNILYFQNDSEGLEIEVSFDPSTYFSWPQVFGLDPNLYSAGDEGQDLPVTASVEFNGTTILTPDQAFTFLISDDYTPMLIGRLISPGNSIPTQPRGPGSLYTESGQKITFAENTYYPLKLTLYFTDLDDVTRTLTVTRNIAWSGSYTT
jgi:hypothetical protein